MNALLIYNPIAGRKISASAIEKVTEKFAHRDIICTAIKTAGPGDATRIAINEGGKFELIICMGGDGTLNETIGGLLNLNSSPPLAYIPAGTTNVLVVFTPAPPVTSFLGRLATFVHGCPQTVSEKPHNNNTAKKLARRLVNKPFRFGFPLEKPASFKNSKIFISTLI